MNYKKIYFSVLMIALAAAMSVGLMSCKDDIKGKPAVPSRFITGNWGCRIELCKDYYSDFNENLTYSYGIPEVGSGSGTYRILKTLENQKVRTGNRIEEPKIATLFIITVTPNGVFDQIWTYYVPRINHGSGSSTWRFLAVDDYSNGILLTDFLWPLSNKTITSGSVVNHPIFLSSVNVNNKQ